MFKKLDKKLGFLVIALCVLTLALPATYSQAQPKGPPEKVVEHEFLGPDEERLSPFAKARRIDGYKHQGKDWETWAVDIQTIPGTLEDLSTRITIEWRRFVGSDGVVTFETGNNALYSKVAGTRVAVEHEGKLAAWNPTLYLDNKVLELREGPRLVRDPLNPNYGSNTIRWTYKEGATFLGLGGGAEVVRYLRQIEGLIQELYVLEEDPLGTLKITNGYEEEKGFKWTEEPFAYDAEGRPLEVIGNEKEKIVDAREFSRKGVEYPVTVDPTTDVFYGNYRDGYLGEGDADYSTAWGASSAGCGNNNGNYLYAGQEYFFDWYWIERSFVYFDTSSLPDDAVVDSAELDLKVQATYDYEGSYDSALQIQDGMPTYPSDPLHHGDYYKDNYSGSGLEAGQWFDYATAGSYETYTLSAEGQEWINSEGWTKFALRSTDDISGTFPGSGTESESFRLCYYATEYGSGYTPKLTVTYSIAVTKPIVATRTAYNVQGTSARFRGELVDDGNASCNTWFDYGTTASYGYSTPSEDGYTSGDSFYYDEVGLEYGTVYHYTARAQSSYGTSDNDDETFLTKPNTPTSFSVTEGDEQNSLSWSKGTGSNKTLIRRSTTGYPTSITEGTEVYFNTGTSTTDTSLSNGTTYYYSAWGEQSSGDLQQYSSGRAEANGTPYTSGPPGVTTNPASSVETDSAILNGYLDALNGEASADCYFEWGETGTGMPNTESAGTLSQVDSFSASIGTLSASTQHEFRAYATSAQGTTYGDTLTFTTGDPSAPTIATQSATGVSQDETTLWGEVTDDGDAVVTAYFEWGETTSYGTQTSSATGLYTGDQIYETLTGLEPGTTYHFRVMGENSQGTSYGGDETFTTDSPSVPTATTLSATDVGATAAMLHGQIDTDGGVDTDARFAWSTNGTLSVNTTSSGWQADKRSGDTFSKWATNLTIDTTYYFRAEAQNAGGSINGSILNFTTIFAAPQEFKAVPLTSTTITLSWVPQSDKTIVVAKEGSFPADRLDGEQAYFGSGSSVSYEGLSPGTTYFFRAWSWRDGNNYSGTYAEDAATTTSSTLPSDVDTPYGSLNKTIPERPSWFWQTPTSDNIQNWPGVGLVDSVAAEMGMALGTMWIIVAGVGAMLVGAAAATIVPIAWAVLGAGALSLFILSLVGVMTGWVLVLFILVGGGLLLLFRMGV